MIFFGHHSLERALKQYVAHYHRERDHQGLDNQLINPDEDVRSVVGKIECRERLGGLLKYHHEALRDMTSRSDSTLSLCSNNAFRVSSDHITRSSKWISFEIRRLPAPQPLEITRF
ncbi:MAG: hypothetical protein R3C11_29505 [Planctomycetaceae bacterium]